MAVWRLQVNTGGANVADYCCKTMLQHLGLARYLLWSVYQGNLHVSDELIEKIYIDFFNRLPEFMQNALSEDFRVA